MSDAQRATGVKNAYVLSGGGTDTATMAESVGDDLFNGRHNRATLEASDGSFLSQVHDFATVSADMSTIAGDTDTAYLFDGATDDKLVADPVQATVDYDATASPGVNTTVLGYTGLYATSAAGVDSADLTGATGDDRLIANPEVDPPRSNVTYLSSTAVPYVLYTTGFTTTTADVSAGPITDNDVAYLNPSAATADALVAGATSAMLTYDPGGGGTPQSVDAQGFGQVISYAANAGDTAVLNGSAAGEKFYAFGDLAYMVADDSSFYNLTRYYDDVTATSGGGAGADIAYLYDRGGNDTFALAASPAVGTVDFDSDTSPGVDLTATGYAKYIAYSTTGGDDDISMAGTAANDTLFSIPGVSRIYDAAATYELYANSFETITVVGGGAATFDTAQIYDDTTDDAVEMAPAGVTINYNAPADPLDIDITATGFELAYVYSLASATDTDTAVLLGSSLDDAFYSYPVVNNMRNAGALQYLNYTHGFQTVTANVTASGGTDAAFLYDSDGADTFTFNQNDGTVALRPTSGADVDVVFSGFRNISAEANTAGGGIDVANLIGTLAADRLYATGDRAYFQDSALSAYYNYVRYFEEVYADPGDTTTGNDTLTQDPITYTLDTTPINGNEW